MGPAALAGTWGQGPKVQVFRRPDNFKAQDFLEHPFKQLSAQRNMNHNPEAPRTCVTRLGATLHNLFWTQRPRFQMVFRLRVRHDSRFRGKKFRGRSAKDEEKRAVLLAIIEMLALLAVGMPDIDKLFGCD